MTSDPGQFTPYAESPAGLGARFAAVDQLFPSRPLEALAAVEGLLPALEASSEAKLLGQALLLKGNALVHLGRAAEAEAYLAEAELQLKELGYEQGLVGVLNLRGILASRRSDYVGSIRWYQEALGRARDRLEPRVVANLAGNLGLNLAYVGEFANALTLLQESVDLWREVESPAEMIPTLINLGFASSKAEQYGNALKYFEEAYARAVTAGDAIRQVIALSNCATQLGHLGRSADARDRAARAVAIGREQPVRMPFAHALESWASCEEEAGNSASARAALDEALMIYEAEANRRGVAVTHLHLAEMERGEPAKRRMHLNRALEAARVAELKPEQARALAALAELAQERGHLVEAYAQLRTARNLERALYDEETQRRLAVVQVQHDLESLQRELEGERVRRTETAALLEDVRTQREMAEEESRQKTAILQIAAHDLRAMAAGVIGCLELAEQDFIEKVNPAIVQESISDARGAAYDLLELLDRLMDLSAIERGVISVELEPVELVATLGPVLHRWKQVVAAKEQTLEISATANWVLADGDRLRQIVSNLISNAAKYSPPGNPIEVHWELRGERVRIAIRDRGPGLSEEDQEQMFRPFQKLSARPTGGEQSTGLGLHIVKALVDKQGASLGYARRKGGGSEFFLEFPAASPGSGDITGGI